VGVVGRILLPTSGAGWKAPCLPCAALPCRLACLLLLACRVFACFKPPRLCHCCTGSGHVLTSSPAPAPVASLGGGSATEIVFFLNGNKKVAEPHLEPDLSLIQYLPCAPVRLRVRWFSERPQIQQNNMLSNFSSFSSMFDDLF
jgi:hypothetical protein